MRNAVVRGVLLSFLLAVPVAQHSLATETTHVVRVTCPGGVALWLWVEGEDYDCSQPSVGEYLCHDSESSDQASARCGTGCTRVSVGSIAGCFYGDGSPSTIKPNFTVSCENGRKFDLTGVAGDTCQQIDKGTPTNPQITGGKCARTQDGEEKISTAVDCNSGCLPSQWPADCKER